MTSIEDLSWMSGQWIFQDEKSYLEEIWTTIYLKTMLGSFRWYKNDKEYIYEILQLKEFQDSVELRIRHFDDHFNAWEEKDTPQTFKLVEYTNQKAVFSKDFQRSSGYLVYSINEEEKLVFQDFNGDGTLSFELIFTKRLFGKKWDKEK